jgi:hypothetical protein
MICSHAFCLCNALQIKNITQLKYILGNWSDEPNPNDPSTRGEIPKARQMKKLSSFVDKMAEKARLRRAQHKGGRVPGVLKKVNVEFYVSDEDKDKIEGEEKDPGKVQKVEMFDLMLKRGTTVKAYSK